MSKLKKNVQPEKIANWRSNRHKHTALKLLESLRPKKLMTFQILHILSLFLLPFSPSNVIKTLHVSRVLAHKFYLQKHPAGGSEARLYNIHTVWHEHWDQNLRRMKQKLERYSDLYFVFLMVFEQLEQYSRKIN